MRSLRFLRRPLSIVLLIVFVGQLAMPSVSYALTAGPTSPEFSSFEPVDTTDMVDLKTGDFSYNTPIIEVPGPAGGYPLSLSYHAGIQPDQEASWVGLGWALNPGAISRFVNGYPDDYQQVDGIERTFWQGGKEVDGELGVNIGLEGAPQVTAMLTVAHDTYRGWGVGGEVGITSSLFGIAEGLGVKVGLSAGVDPWGTSHVGVKIEEEIGR